VLATVTTVLELAEQPMGHASSTWGAVALVIGEGDFGRIRFST
jgi:hypothetical protein